MNKLMFWTGLIMILIQLVGGVLTYGTYWALSQGLTIGQLAIVLCFGLFNLVAGIFVILGASSDEL